MVDEWADCLVAERVAPKGVGKAVPLAVLRAAPTGSRVDWWAVALDAPRDVSWVALWAAAMAVSRAVSRVAPLDAKRWEWL